VRILFSLLDATEAGGQRVALAVATALAGSGWSLGVLAPAPGRVTDAFEALGARFHRADIRSLRNSAELPAVARALRSYDALYSHTSIPGEILGGLSARMTRRAHVVHRHTPAHLSPSPTVGRLQSGLYRILLRHAPVIAVSPQVRSSVLELGVRPDLVTIVPNGAQPSIAPSPPRSDGRLRIGLLGRIDPQKGMDLFLKAVGGLQDEAEFVIGGIGGAFPDYEREVRNRANQLGVEILDTEGQGIEFLSGLDIVVMPSRWEGSPLTLFEAMALQKAIVATDIPGISEVLRPNGGGVLVEPDDVGGLAEAVLRLIRDPRLRAELATAAREGSATFSEERMVKASVAILHEAIGLTSPQWSA
jgi:glycosyltransferase involved in cell wall biosynthesis